MDAHADNVWVEQLDDFGDGVRGVRLRRASGSALGAAVWELEPGAEGVYHLHHGTEELLIVLRGRPTLRTPVGERELVEGEVVPFPRGLEGAHALANRTGTVVRYVIAAAHASPDVVEYPDRGTIGAFARTTSASGGPLRAVHRIADAVPPE